ncbi:phosphatidylglycerophosphatase A family protein [Brevibacillus migulae]|uniref:phosphatidylglycerophosphatase A family protein n=1 Tax=Brevibacillus migulae TaxID=1644114 RepID=UPI00106E08DE|nr:phosphatidylglycerophosphatase A [Brevibacillus migulae]
MKRKVLGHDLKGIVVQKLADRGVLLTDIAHLVYTMQLPYNPDLTMDTCLSHIEAVLAKREMQHAILIGIELDEMAENKWLSEPLQSIIESDDPLFGCDETLAAGACAGYGSIAFTTFGYLDKQKVGVIQKLDSRPAEEVHTFLDDLIAAIAAAACGRVAHHVRDDEEGQYLKETRVS